MAFYEKKISGETVFKGRLLTVDLDKVELEDGYRSTREVVYHPGGVCVVAIDNGGNLLVVRQYRYAIGSELTEIPAGKLEPGEDPRESAIRELSEETGCSAETVVSLGATYATPGYCSEKIHIYLALGLTDGKQHLDKGEFLAVERVPFRDFAERAASGEICDAKTVIGVLRAAAYLEKHSIKI